MQKSTWFFFSNSKMLKKRYGSVSVSDMNPRKTCMVPLLYPAQNGTNEKCYGSVFGSVLYRNHGSESWSTFCSVLDRVDQLELVKKNSQIVDQLLWEIPVWMLFPFPIQSHWKVSKEPKQDIYNDEFFFPRFFFSTRGKN